MIFDGVRYGQKDLELPKFIDLPRRTRVPLELAIAGKNAPIEQLRAAGWRIRHALQVTASVDGYLAYIAGSQGEFGVCKHACVATNTGWFSERSAAYLAKRPTGRHARYGLQPPSAMWARALRRAHRGGGRRSDR